MPVRLPRLLIFGAAVILVAATVVLRPWGAGLLSFPWGLRSAGAAAAVPTGTATVTRTDIVSRQQVNGTIAYTGQYQVVNRLGTTTGSTSSIAQLQGTVDAAAAQLVTERTNLADVSAAQAQLVATAQTRVTAGAAILATASEDGAQAPPGAPAQAPEVATARSQLESARIRLRQLTAGTRQEALTAAQAQLDAASAALEVLLHPRSEDLAAAQSQLERAQLNVQKLLNPRAEDVRSAEAALAAARAQLDVLLHPRPEDLAAAQGALDQARTQLAQLTDRPRTATPQALANAELAVRNAQVDYDRAIADAATAGRPGSSLTRAAAEAAIQQALIALQSAQNDLDALRSQGPSEWEVRQAQEQVTIAQAELDRLRNPSPAAVQAAQAAVEEASTALERLRNPNPYDVQLAQQEVAGAQAALDRLRNPSPAEVQAARAAVAQAQADLQALLSPAEADVQLAQQEAVRAQAALEGAVAADRTALQTAQTTAQAALNQARARVETATTALRNAEAALEAAERGPLVYTWLPAPGAVIERGQPLFEVDGRPVPLLYGDRPAWRRLAPGVPPGPDIGALQANLVALGFAEPELTESGTFDEATAAAVARWQAALGVPQTGAVEPGEVIFLPASLRVTTVRVSAGAPAETGATVMDCTSTVRVVTVPLPVAMQSMVKVGDPVVITLPDGRTRTNGVVSEVSRVATGSSGTGGTGGTSQGSGQGTSGGQPTIGVTVSISDQGAAGSLDQAPVAVAITSDSRAGVLAVPVNALLALSEGGYAVAVREGNNRTLVGVTTGLFDDRGLVEVSGQGLVEGMQVEVPR
ncbi:MAG TPA: peptidoglycan-binding protein [Chloroflexota bacterium]|nr:peptidoglycan-binding protein [Chloroflexota bacterium]